MNEEMHSEPEVNFQCAAVDFTGGGGSVPADYSYSGTHRMKLTI